MGSKAETDGSKSADLDGTGMPRLAGPTWKRSNTILDPRAKCMFINPETFV